MPVTDRESAEETTARDQRQQDGCAQLLHTLECNQTSSAIAQRLEQLVPRHRPAVQPQKVERPGGALVIGALRVQMRGGGEPPARPLLVQQEMNAGPVDRGRDLAHRHLAELTRGGARFDRLVEGGGQRLEVAGWTFEAPFDCGAAS